MAPRGKSETGLTNITAINCDSHEKLFAYGVRLFSKASPPAVMNEHVARMKRERTDINSSSARILTSYTTKAQGLNEPSAVSLLWQYLMFPDADLERGERYMKFLTEAYLESAYVNHPHIPGLSLNSPRADACNGYIPSRKTDDSTQLPFTKEEEAKLTRTPGLPALHWTVLIPWLTAQFKAALAVAGWMTAVHQGAHDGVAVCEYLHQLFTRSGIPFTEEDTCHWSLICDTFRVGLFVHWRTEDEDGVRYHMAQVDEANFRVFWGENNNVPMRRLRDRIRNILDHAREGRLERIKMALKNLPLPPQSPIKSPRHARGWTLR